MSRTNYLCKVTCLEFSNCFIDRQLNLHSIEVPNWIFTKEIELDEKKYEEFKIKRKKEYKSTKSTNILMPLPVTCLEEHMSHSPPSRCNNPQYLLHHHPVDKTIHIFLGVSIVAFNRWLVMMQLPNSMTIPQIALPRKKVYEGVFEQLQRGNYWSWIRPTLHWTKKKHRLVQTLQRKLVYQT